MKLAQPAKLLSVAFLVTLFFTVQFSFSSWSHILPNVFPEPVEEVPPPLTGGEAADIAVEVAQLPLQTTPTLRDALETPIPEIISQPLEPAFQAFIESIIDNQSDTIRGIYVQDVLELPVVQQPEEESTFVSQDLGVVTQFQSAASFGVTGLLAHNYLSGMEFYSLEVGDIVKVVYGDGGFRQYQIESVSQFQKLSPESLRSDFIDLSTGETLPTEEVFARFYRDEGSLTLQTCLERNGLSNWGLTFWKAVPID